MLVNLENRHFLKLFDFSSIEISFLLDLSARLKTAKKAGDEVAFLKGKNIVLIFEKPSTRTRCAFEVAAADQGANTTYLESASSQLGHKESVRDTARVLGRMFDAIEYRGFDQSVVEELAKYAGVPVWNGLTNEFHPTQALADLFTMSEKIDKPLNEIKFAFVGDCRNNMANSLMVAGAKMGMDVRLVGPKELQPSIDLVKQCEAIAKDTGASITISNNLAQGLDGCDFVHTDVWVSMGEPFSVWDERIKLLLPYQINKKTMALTNNEHAMFMHCLPAYHNRKTSIGEEIYSRYKLDGLEVTDEVFESASSIVFDQAENRLHTIKAIMVATMKKGAI